MTLAEPTKEQENLIIGHVCKKLKMYKKYLLCTQPKINNNFKLDEEHPHFNFLSNAEREAYKNISFLYKKINRLHKDYRQIIHCYYLSDSPPSPVQMADLLHVGLSSFHRMRRRALLSLGYAMGYVTIDTDLINQ
ncbi:ArpU family transcriptional regulator [Paenibacillus larvae]|uniref:ArpU family transcriptional regulator n=1 Tax=Paenibacillus larvae TaxID=1464 RepID=UPI002282558A|nr:ArpU family transcriptional regulator [Paenibacillus larvae]MCY9745351.1 ArpU family transcriptional regulator [Paenibacillus larvae]MCY9750217.1 ArpU family transcriptional regulator [Paenibacillus larvae]